jgi:hypothetical protein
VGALVQDNDPRIKHHWALLVAGSRGWGASLDDYTLCVADDARLSIGNISGSRLKRSPVQATIAIRRM